MVQVFTNRAFVTASIKGLQSSIQSLSELKNGVRNRVVRKSVSAGSTPMNTAAKRSSEFKNHTRLLRKSLGRKVRTYKNSGATIAVIGPRPGFERTVMKTGGWDVGLGRKTIKYVRVNPVKYAHLVEGGHGGPAPAPPKRYLRKAFNQSQSTSQNVFSSKFKEALQVEINKAASRLKNG